MAPSCDSGAVACSSGALGCSRHLAGATLLPWAVLVGGGRGRGVGGGCGVTVWGWNCSTAASVITLYNFYLKLYVTLYHQNLVFCNKKFYYNKFVLLYYTSTIMPILYSACYCNNVPAPPVSPPLPSPLCLSSPLPVQFWGLRSGPAGVCCCLQYWGSLLQYCCIDGVWSVSVAAENRFKVLGNHHNGFDFNKPKGKKEATGMSHKRLRNS